MDNIIIEAHPDDEILGKVGTIKKLSKKNKIHLCIVTEGVSAQYTSKNMIKRRKESCIKSGKILGISTFDFLEFNSLSDKSTLIVFDSASIVIISPFLTSAIGPPSWASGTMCPTTNPCVPPENLPSVINATFFPSPAPIIAAVGLSISGIPGPPFGPS